MRVFHLIITWLALVAIPVAVSAHETVLPDLAPVSPEVKARAWPVDPAKGYVVRELKPTVFMITDGRYQSVFMTTEQGVILFDAPPSLTKYLQAAVSEVTKQPIVSLVYSHGHVDHIGGAGTILRGNPQLEIVAEEGRRSIPAGAEGPQPTCSNEGFPRQDDSEFRRGLGRTEGRTLAFCRRRPVHLLPQSKRSDGN